MPDRLASGVGFNPQLYAKKDSGSLTNASVSGSFVGILDGSITGSAVLTNQALVTHTGLSGSEVHGLGTISTQDSDNVNITGGIFSGSIATDNFPASGQVLSYNNGIYRWVDNGSGAVQIQGDWNALTNVPDLVSGSAAIPTGYTWRVSTAGSTVLGAVTSWDVNDLATKTSTSWIKIKSSSTTIFWGNISGSIADQSDLQSALNTKENDSNKSTNTSLGTSDTLYPTQNAVKAYADAHINATGTSVHGLGNVSTQNSSNVSFTGGNISNVDVSGSFTGNVDGSISGSSVATNQALINHENTTGSFVHGLGSISTQNIDNVNITGGTIVASSISGPLDGSVSGSSVVTNQALLNHGLLTGSFVHGLGNISTQNIDSINITGGNITNVSATGSFTGALVGSVTGSSVETNNALLTHAGLTGSLVHGLGDISTQNKNNVDITGGTITGVSLSGSLIGSASLNVLKSGDTMSGSLTISASSTSYALDVDQIGSGSIVRIGNAIDNITIKNNGQIILSGSAIVWDDIPPTQLINARNGGANIPTLANVQGNVQASTFAVGNYVYGAFELLHEYKEGTPIEIHLHWATQSSDNSNRGVKWEVEFTIANLNNTLTPPFTNAFPATITLTNETLIPANTPAKSHLYTDISFISGTSIRIGAYILWRLRRIAATTTPTAPGSNPYAFALGAHIQHDTLGSSTEHSK